MKRRWRLVLSAAAGVTAAAIVLLYVGSVREEAARAQQEALARYGGDVVPVCVATRDIQPGDVIDDSSVSVREWVSSLLPSGALTSLSEVSGRTATSRIPKHAPISEAYFERSDETLEVPKGMAAVSVPSDAVHSVGGSLGSGDRVDVYAAADAVSHRLMAATVLDTSAQESGGADLSWVTLAVREESVPELLAATSKGSVSLVIPAAKTDAKQEQEK